jgi:septum formation protein
LLLLASASPRRTELLDLMGIHHEVVEQKFDEDSVKDVDPIVCSQNIVKGKNISARELLAGSTKENLPILTADTLVFTPNKEIVGKPKDYEHSRKLLREFSGKVHSVFSTVMITTYDRKIVKTCETKVLFKVMDDAEIEEYVLSEEGVGKAGAYGIHGPAGKYITNIEGSYTNVVGLPLHETYEILKELDLA